MLMPLLTRIVITLFGVLNPSYRTYKAIKRKDYQEVVSLGMYWVVFGIFITVELITDTFFPWFPFYYEAKALFVIWLVTPATSGYSLIYRKLIHPELSKRENDIDEAIVKATEKGYTKVVELGAKGLNYAANAVLTTAVMGQGLLADHIRRRSASLYDLNQNQQLDMDLRYRPLGAGDGEPHVSRPSYMANRTPLFPENGLPDEDPFALHWMQTGSTGSLGRHWRPNLKANLSGVPEDGVESVDEPQSKPSGRSKQTSGSVVEGDGRGSVRTVSGRRTRARISTRQTSTTTTTHADPETNSA